MDYRRHAAEAAIMLCKRASSDGDHFVRALGYGAAGGALGGGLGSGAGWLLARLCKSDEECKARLMTATGLFGAIAGMHAGRYIADRKRKREMEELKDLVVAGEDDGMETPGSGQ